MAVSDHTDHACISQTNQNTTRRPVQTKQTARKPPRKETSLCRLSSVRSSCTVLSRNSTRYCRGKHHRRKHTEEGTKIGASERGGWGEQVRKQAKNPRQN